MRTQRRKHEGFTLVEVMVTVAILGILASFAVYNLRGTLLQHQKSAAANEIGALFQQARSMARSTSYSATVTLTQVATAPGGRVVAAIGPPVNWTRQLSFGPGNNYNAVGLVGGPLGPFTFSPRGTVTPSAFVLTVNDEAGGTVTVSVGLLGDVTISP